jgi:hypothetical protein
MGRNTQFLKEADRVISIGFFDRPSFDRGGLAYRESLCVFT